MRNQGSISFFMKQQIIRYIASLLYIVYAIVSIHPVYADQCTNYNLVKQAPPFPTPALKKFRHVRNVYLSSFFEPWHSIQDKVIQLKQPVLVEARFDYSWLLHKDLEDEYVLIYIFKPSLNQWEYLTRQRTNQEGKISIELPGQEAGEYLVRMVVEGDGSFADGFISVLPALHEAIVFDIDGTLTISDFEMVKDYLELGRAEPYYFAKEMLETYRDKGYTLIFLTARPYWMTAISREWLELVLNQGPWPLSVRQETLPLPIDYQTVGTAEYKAAYLKELIIKQKVKIIRAYGNALTDIQAYRAAGIPLSEIYIIGPNAGLYGTRPINPDYSDHYHTVVMATPTAPCRDA